MKDSELIHYLSEKGLVSESLARITPLTGGVSCQILLIDDGTQRFVLKRALEKLKVKADWFADVKRNDIEQQYLKYVHGFMPDVVPSIIYSDAEHHFFCMEMLENGLENWKQQLLGGQYEELYARTAARILATIHQKSAGNATVEAQFNTLKNFTELRIEPYLLACGAKHPRLNAHFTQEAKRLSSTKICLVHGDFSPKNLLVSPTRFVVLDCEVAWYGDPVFDLAFFLNHFLLKALHKPKNAPQLITLAKEAWQSYQNHAGTVLHSEFEQQLTHLLLLLMLARVDGKSPVEYLHTQQQNTIRTFVYRELAQPPHTIATLTQSWLAEQQQTVPQ